MKKKKALSGKQALSACLGYKDIGAIEDYIFSFYKDRMDETFEKNGRNTVYTYGKSHAVSPLETLGPEPVASGQERPEPGEEVIRESEQGKEVIRESEQGKEVIRESDQGKKDAGGTVRSVDPSEKAGDAALCGKKPGPLAPKREPMDPSFNGKEKLRYMLEPHLRALGYSEKDLLRLSGEKASGFEKVTVTKSRLIRYCLTARMDTVETGRLLAVMSYDFSMTEKRNQIISYYLERKLGGLDEVNQALTCFGEMPI